MSTPSIGIPHVAPSQANKMASINSGFDLLDAALTQQSTIDVSGSADVTPAPSSVLPFMCLKLVGVLTGNVNLILPCRAHLYMIVAAFTGGFGVTIRCGAGSTVVLNAGDMRPVYCNGVDAITPN